MAHSAVPDIAPDILLGPASQGIGPTAQPTLSFPASPSSPPLVASTGPPTVGDFISSISLHIRTPILSSPPKLRVSRVPDYSVVPRRSTRLVGKPRAANLVIQATNVMLKKVGKGVPVPASDDSVARRFHETFSDPLSSSKREATRELFPARKQFASWRASE